MSPQATARLEALRSAPLDRWVALSQDETRIVAVGQTFSEVSAKCDEAGEKDPLS